MSVRSVKSKLSSSEVITVAPVKCPKVKKCIESKPVLESAFTITSSQVSWMVWSGKVIITRSLPFSPAPMSVLIDWALIGPSMVVNSKLSLLMPAGLGALAMSIIRPLMPSVCELMFSIVGAMSSGRSGFLSGAGVSE